MTEARLRPLAGSAALFVTQSAQKGARALAIAVATAIRHLLRADLRRAALWTKRLEGPDRPERQGVEMRGEWSDFVKTGEAIWM
jgi:hypothetical protein